MDGRVLGRHAGVVHFTVGQRRGLEIGGHAEPLYVVRIEPADRRLVVGPKAALAVSEAQVEQWNWLAEDQAEVEVKVRSLSRPVPATLDAGAIRFRQPEYGVAPGQAAVAYAGDRLLGGGWISATVSAASALAA
jgi:tRNA-specific 2-thiouridylase